jgi:hypothetical protein
MTFILAEDAALKSLLAGITVTDEKALTDPLRIVSKKALTSNKVTLTTRGAHGFVTVHINRITDEIPDVLTPVATLTQGD